MKQSYETKNNFSKLNTVARNGNNRKQTEKQSDITQANKRDCGLKRNR